MKRNFQSLVLVVALVVLANSNVARADHLFPRTVVSQYYSPPVTTYYTPSVTYYSPAVTYTPGYVTQYYTPSVSYYAAPTVTYYTPSVSYYAAPVVAPRSAVTTTTYGLFGRPKSSTTYYYQPIVVAP